MKEKIKHGTKEVDLEKQSPNIRITLGGKEITLEQAKKLFGGDTK